MNKYEIRVQLNDHPTCGSYSWNTVISVDAESEDQAINKSQKAIKNFAGDRPHNVEAVKWYSPSK